MEYLPGGVTLEPGEHAFPLSTDSVVLKSFVRLPRNARVLDLGSGCGTLGLLLAAEDPHCQVTGIELDERSHIAALQNIRRNGLDSRLTSVCGDLRNLPREFTGQFDCCVSNPPYFSGGPASKVRATARREDCCTPAELFAAAATALKYGGDFFLVHRPERLAELVIRASEQKLEAKRLCLIRHREAGPVTLILLAFRKGGKPGLLWEEQALFDTAGNPTKFFKELYHMD